MFSVIPSERFPPHRARRAALALLLIGAAISVLGPGGVRGSGADGVNFDKPTKDWYKGPVRYIITKQEIKAYKALDTEVERATFIDWFWQRRDIEPATPLNEFRERFETRVFESTRQFSFTTKPGWKTDMGKIYILVGPPDDITKDVMAKTHHGIITWVYRRPPFPDLPPNTVVAFAGDSSGEFYLSASPTLDSDVARGLRFSKVRRTVEDRYLIDGFADPVLLAQGVSLSQGELETALIYGRMMQLPPHEEELFQAFVQTREMFGAIPVESRVDCYKSGDALTYATITVGIKSSAVQYKQEGGREVPDVGVFGKMESRSEPDLVYPLAGDSNFTPSQENLDAGPSDLLLFQATGLFKPGTYEIILGVEDRVSRNVSAHRQNVAIPDLTGEGLRLSSVTLAATMEPTDYEATSVKPYRIGKFRLEPRPGNTFRADEELNIYFQIYGPAVDAATGRPTLDVRYTFKALPPGEPEVVIGAYEIKDSRAQGQGYAVPLKDWPPGGYRVVVSVVDKIAGVTIASDEIPFNIAE
jgi:GWxTD domain-containing protein